MANAAGDSYSILPLLEGKRTGLYARPYTVHHSSEGLFAIRKGDWKLILTGGSGGGLVPYRPDSLDGKPVDIQLYNLRRDPGERRNLAIDMPGKVKALRRWLESARALPQTK